MGMYRICGKVIMVATLHGCSMGMDGVSSGRYHGWDMDALREWIEFVGTSSCLPHGCSAGMGGVCGDVIMVATWMLCGNGWSLLWTLSWLGHGCSAGMDRVCWNLIMVATWMLCGNGWSLWERYHGCHMDALWEWIEFVGTSS